MDEHAVADDAVTLDVESGPLPWHAISVEEAFVRADSTKVGLSKAKAAELLLKNGPNQLTPGESRTLLAMIWEQLYNIITAILLAAVVVAAIFQDWIELGFIAVVIIVNVAIGVIQEGRAEAATKAITAMTTTSALALRNERKVTVDATTLVVGDIVYLSAGDRIPADVRLVELNDMRVVEAALTGESLPVSKVTSPAARNAPLGDRTCMGFMGTFVVSGDGIGLVVATGDNAEIGRINELLSRVEPKPTPLQKQISVFGFTLSVLCIVVAVVSFIVALLGRNFTLHDSFTVAVGIAVALIPEGLPTVVTITLALGVQTMARANAIIRQLSAVETLGSITCICSDKTGTLTKNEMTAVSIQTSTCALQVSGLGYNPVGEVTFDGAALAPEQSASIKQLLLPAVFCNDATLLPVISALARDMQLSQPLTVPLPEECIHPESSSIAFYGPDPQANSMDWYITGDPTEAALLALVMKSGINFRTVHDLLETCPRVSSLPFASENKFMATINDVFCVPNTTAQKHRRFLYVKGATDILLAYCATQAVGLDPFTSEPIKTDFWLSAAAALAKQGMRVLAICQRELGPDEEVGLTADYIRSGQHLQLNCLAAIVDPPREEAIRAVKSCHEAGIVVKMITGDHAATAATIGEWLGITTSEVLVGTQLEAMTDAQLRQHVDGCNIYARTSPEHKLRIVRALQARRNVVAMTGDGVNDGPALRQADVGVAMGLSGTEVAKEASRMILMDDNFATLEMAVRIGRTTYDNLRKLMMFILPTSIAQGFSLAVATYIGVETPLVNIQILFVNMITAATLGLVLAAEESEGGVMARPPRSPSKQLLGKHIVWRSLFVGTLMIVAMLGQFAWSRAMDDSIEVGHTMAMNTLVISQCLYCLSCRFIKRSAFSVQAVIGNRWLTAMVAVNVLIQVLITYTPGVQSVFETESLNGYDWLRILLFAVVIFLIVEFEKAFGPALIRPYVLPAMRRIASLCARPDSTPPTSPAHLGQPRASQHEPSNGLTQTAAAPTVVVHAPTAIPAPRAYTESDV